MKSSSFFAACTFVACTAFGQSEKPVDSKITNVTVFLSPAQVTREVRSQVASGKTNLVITGLTAQLDPESIQVAGKGSFTILGISHRQNFLTEINTPKSLRMLQDSVDLLLKQSALEQSQKEILSKEEQMLLSNQKIGGTNQNLSVTELKAMADFYRSRLSDIVTTRMKEDEKISKINARIAKLQQQVSSQNELLARNTSEIVVSLSADAATSVALDLNYIVSNAGWNALYDLRAVDVKSPIRLSYKANVFQATGEDWKDVRLKLSTANPNLSGLKPELNAWYLNLDQPNSFSYHMYNSVKSSMSSLVLAEQQDDKMKDMPNKSIVDFVSTIQTSLNTEFDIALPYTVSSSSKPTVVDIRNYEMKADYTFSVAPKLDADAFLLARATGWEEYSLLPGEANIFFEGTFVGKTFIDPNSTKDTLSISLGRDKRIAVKREHKKELNSRKMIGTNQKDISAWEITIRNNKAEAVRITVEDQIPVSQNSQIEVTATDTGGAKYLKDTGILSWELALQPGETKRLAFKYEVKYPKGKIISGL